MKKTFDVLGAYSQHMLDKREAEGPKPTACNTMMRISDSGSCKRQISFNALKIPEIHRIEASTLLAFSIGTHMHTVVQDACLDKFGGEYETAIDLSSTGVSLSGSCDGIIEVEEGKFRLLEIKTVSGFGMKIAKEDDVPKLAHITQAALYAIGAEKEIDELMICYIAKESDFRSRTRQGDVIEWVIGLDEHIESLGATPRELAERELEKFRQVQADLASDKISDAICYDDYGVGTLVENPPGYGASKGQPWNCRYCRYNSICSVVGPVDATIASAQYHAENLMDLAEELV
tara:strand:+ start:1241 stop:2110 length:870 start_codon:yes stop_codon:yes gene_type:complete